MNIDLTALIIDKKDSLVIKETINFPQDLFLTTNIRKLEDIYLDATITKNLSEEYEFLGKLTGKMILPDDITLEDVELPIDIEFNEKVTEDGENNENNLTIIKNRLDIIPFLWQNIIVEIPLKVINEKNKNLTLKGNGWRLITEEELHSNNLPFSHLDELIDSRKE